MGDDMIDNNDVVEEIGDVEINTSQDGEQIQETTEEVVNDDIQKQIEERANKLFEEKVEERLIRDRKSRERKQNEELSKYRQLESVIKAGLGVDTIDDAISRTSKFYKDQGITIPEFTNPRTEWEEGILAEARANQVIEAGTEEIREEVARLSEIPYEKKTKQEKVIFDTLCKKLTSLNDIEEMKSKGYKTDILETKEFKQFRENFTAVTPILTVYDLFKKANGLVEEKPASAGSARTSGGETKAQFTPEQINKMSPQEIMKYWNNPEFRKVAGLN